MVVYLWWVCVVTKKNWIKIYAQALKNRPFARYLAVSRSLSTSSRCLFFLIFCQRSFKSSLGFANQIHPVIKRVLKIKEKKKKQKIREKRIHKLLDVCVFLCAQFYVLISWVSDWSKCVSVRVSAYMRLSSVHMYHIYFARNSNGWRLRLVSYLF